MSPRVLAAAGALCLLLAPCAGSAQAATSAALVPGPAGPVLSPAETERMLARTGEELERDPLPSDARVAMLELALVEDQRDAIDITGINAVQWIGASVIIAGGVIAVLSAAAGLLVGIAGGDSGATALAVAGGVLLGAGVLGGLMLGLAELDGDLHRRRELDGRARRLRDALRRSGLEVGVSPFVSPAVAGLRLDVVF